MARPNAHQVTEPSAKGQTADPVWLTMPPVAASPKGLALPIEMRIQATPLELNGSSQGIDPRSGHGGQVDDDPAVTDGVAGNGVAAAPLPTPAGRAPGRSGRRP